MSFTSLPDFDALCPSDQENYLGALSERNIPLRLPNMRDTNSLSKQLTYLVDTNTIAQGERVIANSDQTMLYCSNYIYRGTTDWFKFCVNMHGLIVECERITPSAHSLNDS
jgi:hypothetical protein